MVIDIPKLLTVNEKKFQRKIAKKKSIDKNTAHQLFIHFKYCSWLYCLKYTILDAGYVIIIIFNLLIKFTIYYNY